MRSAVLVILTIQTASFAQNTTVQTAFEVISAKRSDPSGTGRPSCHGGPGTDDPGRLPCTNVALNSLVTIAYNLQFSQIVSPDWMNLGGAQNGYDVVATIPVRTSKDDYRLMLQKLLAERFHLIVNREVKQLPCEVLSLGKGGLKIKSSASTPPPPGPRFAMDVVTGHLHYAQHIMSLASFANMLITLVAGPVTDETGLQGDYDFAFDFMPDDRWRGFGILPKANSEKDDVANLSQAVQQQLGLKLESLKCPVTIVLVDHADKVPVEN
jgi:uncharacterized protein (TIGR03435 family)